MAHKKKLPADDTIAKMYRDGMSMRDIAQHYHVVLSAVQYRLARMGVPRRTRSEACRLARKRRGTAKLAICQVCGAICPVCGENAEAGHEEAI